MPNETSRNIRGASRTRSGIIQNRAVRFHRLGLRFHGLYNGSNRARLGSGGRVGGGAWALKTLEGQFLGASDGSEGVLMTLPEAVSFAL